MKLSSVPVLACAIVLACAGCSDPEENDGFGYGSGATGGSEMGTNDLGSGGSGSGSDGTSSDGSGGAPSGTGGTNDSGGAGASSSGGVNASGGSQSVGGASAEECAALKAEVNVTVDELQRCDPTMANQCQMIVFNSCGCQRSATSPGAPVEYLDAFLNYHSRCLGGFFCVCDVSEHAGECVETTTGAFCDR